MKAIAALIKRRPVLTYFVLTLLISWSSLLLIIGPGGFIGATEVPAEQTPILIFAMLLGPTIAGLLMTGLIHGRQGFGEFFARLRLWRVGVVWYLIAILTAPLLVAVTSLVLSSSSPAYIPVIVTSGDKVTLIVFGLIAGAVVGIFEEIGWTGFAIPGLRQRHGILATGLTVGLVWGLWHLPLFASSARTSRSIPAVLTLAVMLFTFLPAFRVLMVWVYDRTGSLIVAMLMHLGQTATAFILAIPATADQTVVHDLLYAVGLWVFIAVIALTDRGQLRAGAQARPAVS